MSATATMPATDLRVTVCSRAVRYVKAGTGAPVVVFHHSTGSLGWTAALEALAEHNEVYVFDMPGYGGSERPEWARDTRDLAVLMNQAIEAIGLGKAHLLGFGFGGFVAAELATMDPSRVRTLTLVGAAGLKPREGEIMDEMLMDHVEYMERGFRDKAHFEAFFGTEQEKSVKDLWDYSREMTARVAWKPFMFSNRLPHHLDGVPAPALLIWGAADAVIPPICAQQYHDALPNARLEIVADAGHYVEYEEPATVAKLIGDFLASH